MRYKVTMTFPRPMQGTILDALRRLLDSDPSSPFLRSCADEAEYWYGKDKLRLQNMVYNMIGIKGDHFCLRIVEAYDGC
jgi:hypothetical protein